MPVWSEQDVMIGESARAFFRGNGGVGRVRTLRQSCRDVEFWRGVAGQGWIGMLVPENLSGSGFELRDALVVMRAVGEYLPPEPLAAAIAMARSMQHMSQLASTLADIVAGKAIVLPAFADGLAAGSSASLRTRPVAGLAMATHLVVIDGSEHVRLAAANDFRKELHRSLDGGSVGIAEIDHAETLDWNTGIQRDLFETWSILLAAELVGIATEALKRTLGYLETRRQFGAVLSSFQALQQRAADVHVATASAEALVFEAARAFGGPQQSFAAAAALACALKAANAASREAIQMHGAIGFTDEYDIGLFLKRTMAIAAISRDLRAIDLAHRVN